MSELGFQLAFHLYIGNLGPLLNYTIDLIMPYIYSLMLCPLWQVTHSHMHTLVKMSSEVWFRTSFPPLKSKS